MVDLVLRRCRLRGMEGLSDIAVAGDRIVAVEEEFAGRGNEELDVEGRLTLPAFIDPHIHLDKAMIADVVRPSESGTLTEAIEIIREKKTAYTVDDIVERATRTVESAVLAGTTRLRTHVDVDTVGKLTPLQALLEVRRRCADIVDLQIVAFPQEGIVKDPGCEELMYQAMELGADVVGGMPANERTPDDSRRHIDICFQIARKFSADIDMHVDETDGPFDRTLEMLADKTIEEGYQGRVTAGHACALAAYDDHYADKLNLSGLPLHLDNA